METTETKKTDAIIYTCGVLALIMAIVIVVLCRMQVHPRREPFDALPVQKLSKFPLRRQVQAIMHHGNLSLSSTNSFDRLLTLTEDRQKVCRDSGLTILEDERL